MGYVVAVACPKGGVGKTTVAVNLASALADKGFACLLVGVDPQCGLSGSFARRPREIQTGLSDLLLAQAPAAEVVQPSGVANLDFIPSHVWTREDESRLVARLEAEPSLLADRLGALHGNYDFLFLDCPPNLGSLTHAALLAAEGCILPVQAEELACQALARFHDHLDALSSRGLRAPAVWGIVLNQVDARTRLAAGLIARLRAEYGDRVLRTMIPRTIRLGEVAQRGKPVDRFNRSGAAASAFAALADEILQPLAQRALGQAAADGLPDSVARAERVVPDSLPWEPVEPAPVEVEVSALAGLLEPASGAPIEGDGEDRRFISLEEIDELSPAFGSRTCPDLDDYDEVEDDGTLH